MCLWWNFILILFFQKQHLHYNYKLLYWGSHSPTIELCVPLRHECVSTPDIVNQTSLSIGIGFYCRSVTLVNLLTIIFAYLTVQSNRNTQTAVLIEMKGRKRKYRRNANDLDVGPTFNFSVEFLKKVVVLLTRHKTLQLKRCRVGFCINRGEGETCSRVAPKVIIC